MAEVRANQYELILDEDALRVGRVYAEALFGAAEKAGESDRVLEELGYLVPEVAPLVPADTDEVPATDDVPLVTDEGRRLARIWSEADLLVAECLRAGVWRGLTAAELAAVVSTLVFEARRETPGQPAVPAGTVAAAIAEMRRIRLRLEEVESERGVPLTILRYAQRHELELWSFATGEAQAAAIADDIAYDAHDIDDGLRAELFRLDDIAEVPLAGAADRTEPGLRDVFKCGPRRDTPVRVALRWVIDEPA